MRRRFWVILVMAFFAFTVTRGLADDHGNGHGRGHDKKHAYEDDDHGHDFYRDHDRHAMRDWYEDHHHHLPPGLAKRDELPPGLERQLVVRGTLPPGLRKRMQPCPPDLVRVLPPPPPDCEHVVIGGHVVLLNRVNFQIVDVFHFEM